MIQRRYGTVVAINETSLELQRLVVRTTEGEEVSAVNYPPLTGESLIGDRVLLNCTAVTLGLGSGGWDFVMAIDGSEQVQTDAPKAPGHLMKLRYTPGQVKVLVWDEETSPVKPTNGVDYGNLAGTPVLIAGIHSLLEPTLRALWSYHPGAQVVYIMTDGACLPLAWSQSVARLKAEGLITTTVTSGHAFGGDYEALNSYSALACAQEVVTADYIFISMGPGIPGTGTRYGSTALEVGELVNAVITLNGQPITIPRISQADLRSRHYGISHHFLTALQRIAFASAYIPLSYFHGSEREWLGDRVAQSGLDSANYHGILHQLSFHDVTAVAAKLQPYISTFRSMGRSYAEDPLHFAAGFGAAELAYSLRRKRDCLI